MRYEILNREKKYEIPFKEKILELVRTNGEELILGYGYIEPDAVTDDFIDAIKIGFNGVNYPKICIIGTNDENSISIAKYIMFAGKIQSKLTNCTIELYIAKKRNYNKRVAIKFSNDKLIMAITDSRNFSKKNFTNFNQEIDILFRDSGDYCINIEKNSLEEFCKKNSYKEKIEKLESNILKQINTNIQRDIFTNKLIDLLKDHDSKSIIDFYKNNKSGFENYSTELDRMINGLEYNFSKLKFIEEHFLKSLFGEIKNQYNFSCNIIKELNELANEIKCNDNFHRINEKFYYIDRYITQEQHNKLVNEINQEDRKYFEENIKISFAVNSPISVILEKILQLHNENNCEGIILETHKRNCEKIIEILIGNF